MLPAPILLPTGGGNRDKVYICAVTYHACFQILINIQLLLRRKLRHSYPQASMCQSKVFLLLSLSLQNELQAAFCWGRVLGAHLVACGGEGQPGSRAGDGGAGGGVWLEEQLLGGGVSTE